MQDLTKDQKTLCQVNNINPYSVEIYLDYVNNYVSYKTMAVDYGVTPETMHDMIQDCRKDYKEYCELTEILATTPF